MAVNFTKEQRQAIASAGGPIVVAAAAGSGKTAVLVERAVRIICDRDNPTPCDRLLIVTFTRAAANEMSRRISVRLEQEVRKEPTSVWLKKQLLLLPSAEITTIDSFCINVAREYFYELDIPAAFKVADKADILSMENTAMEQTVEEMYLRHGELFSKLGDALYKVYDDNGIICTLKDLHRHIRATAFEEDWYRRAVENYDCINPADNVFIKILLDYFGDMLSVSVGYLDRLLGNFGQEDNKTVAKALSMLADQMPYIKNLSKAVADGDIDKLYTLIAAFSPIKLPNKPKEVDSESWGMLKSAAAYINDNMKLAAEFFTSDAAGLSAELHEQRELTEILLDALKLYSDRLWDIKRERELYDFNDIEHFVLELICRRENGKLTVTDSGCALIDKYSYIMVDEYQDTNSLQDTIFDIISDGGKNLFTVGDSKQSIYRFRQANPAIFIGRQQNSNAYEDNADGGKILLSENFRSRKEVCDSVNEVFSALMSPEIGEIHYDSEQELISGADYPEVEGQKSEFTVIDRAPRFEGEIKSDEKSERLEAAFIADKIKEFMETGRVYDFAEKEYRKPQYSDFAVLMRSISSHADIFRDELARHGIPAWCRARASFFDSVEVNAVLSLLKAADNPRRDTAMLNLMLSPIGNLTPDEVAEIRLYRNKGSLYGAMLLAEKDGNESAKQILSLIAGVRKKSLTLSLPLLISHIYEVSGYYAVVGAMEDGADRQSNLRSLTALAERYEQNSDSGLSGFVRYITEMVDNEAEIESASIPPSGVVSIVSIHASKGLEYPVVFLSSCGARFRSDTRDTAAVSEKYGVGFCRIDSDGIRRSSAAQRAIELESRREELSETLRLLYVALTRAKEKLYITAVEDNLSSTLDRVRELYESSANPMEKDSLPPFLVRQLNSFSKWFYALFYLNGTLHDGAIATDNGSIALNVVGANDIRLAGENESKEQSAEPDKEEAARIAERLTAQKISPLSTVSAKITASELNAMDHGGDYDFTAKPSFAGGSSSTATGYGTAVHAFMQYCDFERAASDVESELDRLVDEGHITVGDAEKISKRSLKGFFESDIFKRISRSEKIYREMPFTVLASPSEFFDGLDETDCNNCRVVVQGVCDLAFVEDGSLVIVDYKTDRAKSAGELMEKYQRQLMLYARAMSEITGKRVSGVAIYSFFTGSSALTPL